MSPFRLTGSTFCLVCPVISASLFHERYTGCSDSHDDSRRTIVATARSVAMRDAVIIPDSRICGHSRQEYIRSDGTSVAFQHRSLLYQPCHALEPHRKRDGQDNVIHHDLNPLLFLRSFSMLIASVMAVLTPAPLRLASLNVSIGRILSRYSPSVAGEKSAIGATIGTGTATTGGFGASICKSNETPHMAQYAAPSKTIGALQDGQWCFVQRWDCSCATMNRLK